MTSFSISVIKGEIEWIDYEITRQSTTKAQEESLLLQKKALIEIRSAIEKYELLIDKL